MAMVVVDDSCLQADSQPKSRGLVWGSAAACALRCIHQMNRVNSRNDLWSWWRHYKYRPGIIIIIIIIIGHRLARRHNGGSAYRRFAFRYCNICTDAVPDLIDVIARVIHFRAERSNFKVTQARWILNGDTLYLAASLRGNVDSWFQ